MVPVGGTRRVSPSMSKTRPIMENADMRNPSVNPLGHYGYFSSPASR